VKQGLSSRERYRLSLKQIELEVRSYSSGTTGSNRINNNSNHKKATRWVASSEMVGRAGFEPATNWLKANCSTD
jgi:hypothetical protein